MKPFRVLPKLDDTNRHFWTGGADGELRILRCGRCRYWVHPPGPVCPACLAGDLTPEAVSGRATVHTYTVNHQPWYPGLDPPYVVAIVALPEQEGLRLTTNVVGCAPADVHIGMPVQVVFEPYDDVWLPLFEPVPGAGDPVSGASEPRARARDAAAGGGERAAGAPARSAPVRGAEEPADDPGEARR